MKTKPAVDDLSQQIVESMEDRKRAPIHERLYTKGKEKLRKVQLQSEKKPSSTT